MQLDFAIYGASFEGLLVASFLHQHGYDVAVFEPSSKVGANFSPVIHQHRLIPGLFNTLSDNPENNHLFQSLAEKLGFHLDLEKQNLPPITFEKGHLEPFVGFGESAPEFVDYLSDYLHPERLCVHPTIENWIETLANSGLKIQTLSTATAVNIENGKITELVLNDKDHVHAENYIFTIHPSELTEVLGAHNIPAKVAAKLSKQNYWSTVQLSLVHEKPITPSHAIHFLYGTQKNPTVSVGRFVGSTSQWVSLVASDSFDVNEEGAQALKELKRQLKRAYPQAFDHVVFEKIALLPKTHGFVDLKQKQFGQVDGIENLCLCSSHLVESTQPLLGSLKAAQWTIQLLQGFLGSEKSEKSSDFNQINA